MMSIPQNSIPDNSEDPDSEVRVLLVEDEEAIRRILSRVLRKNGYTVIEAGNGKEAMEACGAAPPHVLITDIVMPEMDGVDLVESLRQRQPELRVLYISGYTFGDVMPEDDMDSRSAFMHKPFDPGAMIEKVRELMLR